MKQKYQIRKNNNIGRKKIETKQIKQLLTFNAKISNLRSQEERLKKYTTSCISNSIYSRSIVIFTEIYHALATRLMIIKQSRKRRSELFEPEFVLSHLLVDAVTLDRNRTQVRTKEKVVLMLMHPPWSLLHLSQSQLHTKL